MISDFFCYKYLLLPKYQLFRTIKESNFWQALDRIVTLDVSVSKSSCSHMFYKIGVLKTFYKIHKITSVPESLFVAGLQAGTLLRKRLRHRCFPVNFATVLRTPILYNISELPILRFEEVIIQNHIKNVLHKKISF